METKYDPSKWPRHKGKTYTIIIPSIHGRAYRDFYKQVFIPCEDVFGDGVTMNTFNKTEYQNNIYKLYGQAYRGKQCTIKS